MQQEPLEFDDPDLKAILKRAIGAEVAPATLRQRIVASLETQQQTGEFHDPDLKTMLKRAVGSEVAPAALRGRIEAALAGQQRRQQTMQALRPRWHKPVMGIAAAAVLLLGFGLTYTLLFAEKAAPQWFAAGMVTSHTGDFAGTALPPGVVVAEDYASIRKSFGDDLGFPVLAEPLGDGWVFKGARLCSVSNQKGAQLSFTKGDQTISVFSLPTAMLSYSEPAKEGMNYSQIEQGHAISGFVRGKAIHCLISSSKSGTPDLKALTQMREKLRAMQQ